MAIDPAPDARPTDHRPVLLRASRPADRRRLDALRAAPGTVVFDRIEDQVAELLLTRRPGEHLAGPRLALLVAGHIGGDRERFGTWAWYPWSARLVHVLDEDEFVEVRTDRNRDKVTAEEQHTLAGRAVGIVGLSVGSAVALTIALERGCGRLRLADFDVVGLSNLNRLRCGVQDLGVAKAVVAARAIAELDPYLEVECMLEGVGPDSVEAFLDGLDLVVDECDSLDVKLELRSHARKRGLPLVMATSDRGMLDVERYDLEPDAEAFHGLLGDVAPDQLRGLSQREVVDVAMRILPPEALSPRLRDSMGRIGSTLSTWPQLGADVALGGGQVAEVARRILLGEPVPSGRTVLG